MYFYFPAIVAGRVLGVIPANDVIDVRLAFLISLGTALYSYCLLLLFLLS